MECATSKIGGQCSPNQNHPEHPKKTSQVERRTVRPEGKLLRQLPLERPSLFITASSPFRPQGTKGGLAKLGASTAKKGFVPSKSVFAALENWQKTWEKTETWPSLLPDSHPILS